MPSPAHAGETPKIDSGAIIAGTDSIESAMTAATVNAEPRPKKETPVRGILRGTE
jgi:hypothetical protein